MKKHSSIRLDTFTPPSHEDISRRARELWERHGRPEGRDQEIWLEAERQLLGVDPLVEGKEDAPISSSQFDPDVSQGKRPGKTPSAKKPAATARARR